MSVEEFRDMILQNKFDELLDNFILSGSAMHVTPENHKYINQFLAKKYGVLEENVNCIIVGSAKLGFSISEKKSKKGGINLQRYRPFRPESDIDIAVISKHIYEIIWNELSTYAFNQNYLPWDSEKLGDYLVYGWLRPDHFPKNKRLRRCDDWFDTFRSLSSQRRFGYRQIRGGLFYSREQLKQYQLRALKDCMTAEKLRR